MAETIAGSQTGAHADPDPTRRDFILIATGAAAAVGLGATVWPFVAQMNPAADTLALASTEVDLSGIEEGQQITLLWRGLPVFVRHRTAAEIQAAKTVQLSELKDPETDDQRIEQVNGQPGQESWLVLQAACTHLGCVPTFAAGDFGGWFCPCHGSHYDTAGRIRKGPAPLNLVKAPYVFISDNVIKIG